MSGSSTIPIILCGGFGSRLWPLSRNTYPKQFLSLNPHNNKTLLQKTLLRLEGLENISKPIVICNEENRFVVAEQMREINIKPLNILLEPFGRNTAPAITLGALVSLEKENDPNLLVLAADHEISNKKNFHKSIKEGFKYSQQGRLVTFGIKPTYPETGYGYIETYEKTKLKNGNCYEIKSFSEKPDIQTARQFLKCGNYLWNSGMFTFKAKKILEELKKNCPDIVDKCKNSLKTAQNDLDFQRIGRSHFNKCPNLSIDSAVMEKTDNGSVVTLEAGWSDIGSWEALWKISQKDKNNNFKSGNVILKDSKNSYFHSSERLLVGLGLEDIIAIETSDAVLVTKKRESQNVKEIVRILDSKNIIEGKEHKKIYRPWGYHISLVEDNNWKVKIIMVKPGEKLSLQKHKYRAEHWVVVKGKATVQIELEEFLLNSNQSIFIPVGSKHRLINNESNALVLIEVQTGSYIKEDDIERFEDNYGRVN